MPRLPLLGLRALLPRAAFISRPLLPVSTHFAGIEGARVSTIRPSRLWCPQLRMFSYSRVRSSSPSPPPGSPDPDSPPPNAPLSQRLKILIKRYGWYALGVYLVLSALDFSVAFATINILGAEQVSAFTHVVKDRLRDLVQSRPPEPGSQEFETAPTGGREGLYAMLILAYTVHKTLFLPIRVGLTAAFTPKFVRWLTARGWVGGEGVKRAGREFRERMRNSRGQ